MKLKVFKNNLNNKYKLLNLKVKSGKVGMTKYLPPFSKEWQNSIYSFNKIKMTNSAIYNINIYKLIRNYFLLSFRRNWFMNSKHMIQRYKAFIIKRIHLSKPSIKHTSTKAIITLFSFNISRNYFFYRKFSKLNRYTNHMILNRSKNLLKKKIGYIISKANKEENKEGDSGWPVPGPGSGPVPAGGSEFFFGGGSSRGIWPLTNQKKSGPAPLLRYQPPCFATSPLASLPAPLAGAAPGGSEARERPLTSYVKAKPSNDSAINLARFSGRIAILAACASKHVSKSKLYLLPYAIWSTSNVLRLAAQVQKKELILFKYKLLNQLVKNLNFYLKIFFYLIKMKKYKKIRRLYYNKLIVKYRRYQYRYYIYKYKFEKTKFLPILTKLLNKFINKKIEYNIINLKSIVYSPDIFTKAISLKLKKRYIRLHKYINYVLGNVRITEDNNVVERKPFLKGYDDNSFVNIHKNLGLMNLVNKDNGSFLKKIRGLRSKKYLILRAQASNDCFGSNRSSGSARSRASEARASEAPEGLGLPASEARACFISKEATLRRKLIAFARNKRSHSMLKSVRKESNIGILNYDKMLSITFNKIQYKKLGGVRILVKGRLTRRYRADRSIYILRWVGGLKNIGASFKGLSDVMYRGYMHSNVLKSFFAGNRRIGAFGVSGWIAGKN